MFPFAEAGARAGVPTGVGAQPTLGRILLVAGWTGLRWSELRAVRVRDFIEVPMPMLVVSRPNPKASASRAPSPPYPAGPGGRPRPADRAGLAAGRDGEAPLCVTSTGHQLHATAFKRTLAWTVVAEGRRIHDLRHTAACLWLARGVDPITVQAWMGHASIATTNIYLHHLGSSADRAGLDRLNRAGARQGHARGGEAKSQD